MQFVEITVEWSLTTLVFYTAIILGCYTVLLLFRKNSVRWGFGNNNKFLTGLILVAFALLVVKCFSTTGRDLRTGYLLNFKSATSMAAYRDQTIELGFRVLMVIVRNLTEDYTVFLFVVGLITVIPVISTINKYSDRIDVPAAILLFTSIYFFSGFSAYRQYMAVSLSLFAFDAIVDRKPGKALGWIAVSSLFHVACLALIIPYSLFFIRMLTKKMIVISAVVFFILLFLTKDRIALLIGSFERYNIYSVSERVSFGMEQVIYYLPMFLLLYICRKNKMDKHMSKIAYIYILTAFVFGMTGYIIPIIGRMSSVFIPIIILVPFYIKHYQGHHSKANRLMLGMITIVYCLARFIIWITQYYILEDLMPYTNVFGMVV